MNTYAEKSQNPQINPSSKVDNSSFLFQDNRPETVAQLKLQELAEKSSNESNAIQLQSNSLEGNPIQRAANNTGLPDTLKSGIEHLSGYSMNDVKVHYNSSKPAQLNAHAYAQGTDIHLASGQEKHLGHEAWHVVQQKQGRVQATKQLKGKIGINDDKSLEHEADVMGAKAMNSNFSGQIPKQLKKDSIFPVLQAKWIDSEMENVQYYNNLVETGGIKWYYNTVEDTMSFMITKENQYYEQLKEYIGQSKKYDQWIKIWTQNNWLKADEIVPDLDEKYMDQGDSSLLDTANYLSENVPVEFWMKLIIKKNQLELLKDPKNIKNLNDIYEENIKTLKSADPKEHIESASKICDLYAATLAYSAVGPKRVESLKQKHNEEFLKNKNVSSVVQNDQGDTSHNFPKNTGNDLLTLFNLWAKGKGSSLLQVKFDSFHGPHIFSIERDASGTFFMLYQAYEGQYSMMDFLSDDDSGNKYLEIAKDHLGKKQKISAQTLQSIVFNTLAKGLNAEDHRAPDAITEIENTNAFGVGNDKNKTPDKTRKYNAIPNLAVFIFNNLNSSEESLAIARQIIENPQTFIDDNNITFWPEIRHEK